MYVDEGGGIGGKIGEEGGRAEVLARNSGALSVALLRE